MWFFHLTLGLVWYDNINMTWVSVICAQCGKEIKKALRNFNENNKYGHKFFCSPKCLANNRKRRVLFNCENPNCRVKFERTPGDVSLHNYCSQSCSAIVNNELRPRIIRICAKLGCKKEFFGDNKYCSETCVPKTQPKYSRQDLLDKIQRFYLINNRVPIKVEFNSQWQAYRRVFGTWNRAISEAGFETNPEMFTHKYTARDGHICDSLTEKIIDDWMYKRKIPHQRGIYYPNQKRFKTDFLVKDKYWIEFLGLKGVLKRYDDLYKQKLEVAKINKIKIIELYPQDLFPRNNLNLKLDFLLK